MTKFYRFILGFILFAYVFAVETRPLVMKAFDDLN